MKPLPRTVKPMPKKKITIGTAVSYTPRPKTPAPKGLLTPAGRWAGIRAEIIKHNPSRFGHGPFPQRDPRDPR